MAHGWRGCSANIQGAHDYQASPSIVYYTCRCAFACLLVPLIGLACGGSGWVLENLTWRYIDGARPMRSHTGRLRARDKYKRGRSHALLAVKGTHELIHAHPTDTPQNLWRRPESWVATGGPGISAGAWHCHAQSPTPALRPKDRASSLTTPPLPEAPGHRRSAIRYLRGAARLHNATCAALPMEPHCLQAAPA